MEILFNVEFGEFILRPLMQQADVFSDKAAEIHSGPNSRHKTLAGTFR